MIDLDAVLAEVRALEAEGDDLLTRHKREFDAMVLRQRAEHRAIGARLTRLMTLVGSR